MHRSPASSTTLPARIGRFEVRTLLDSGCFGSDYRAHDPLLGRAVTLIAELSRCRLGRKTAAIVVWLPVGADDAGSHLWHPIGSSPNTHLAWHALRPCCHNYLEEQEVRTTGSACQVGPQPWHTLARG